MSYKSARHVLDLIDRETPIPIVPTWMAIEDGQFSSLYLRTMLAKLAKLAKLGEVSAIARAAEGSAASPGQSLVFDRRAQQH